MSKFVVIADRDDTGTCRVIDALRSCGCDVLWLALTDKDEHYRLHLSPSSGRFDVHGSTMEITDFADTSLVFYRRWRQREVPAVCSSFEDEHFRAFAEREWDAAFVALLLRIEWRFPHLQWSERPSAAVLSKSRLALLELAAFFGMHTPPWVVSTVAESPLNLGAPLVAKPINLAEGVSDSLSFGTADISPSMAALTIQESGVTPTYFQRRIQRDSELRVYFVFGSPIVLELTTISNVTDIRHIPLSDLSVSVLDCPNDIRKQTTHFCAATGLGFCVFDFVVDHAGLHWLVDVTSNGSWDHFETSANPWLSRLISEAIADRNREIPQ